MDNDDAFEAQVIQLNDNEAAITITDEGEVSFFIPNLDGDAMIPGPFSALMACALRLSSDAAFVEEQLDWMNDEVAKLEPRDGE